MPDLDDDDAADDWDNDDADDESDTDDDEAPTVACPFCSHEIFEGTPRCPSCGRYLSDEDFARGSKPLWVIVTALVCLVIAIWLAFAV